jgi:tRNA(fMet)-specific endonuclease VapC
MYLLDTNTCIDFILARSDRLRTRMRQNLTAGLAISAITLAELKVGSRTSTEPERDLRRLDVFATLVRVHDFGEQAASIYGSLARQVGVKRKSFDRLIGAHALALGLVLVTNNEADFADVPGLKVENWTSGPASS